MPAANPAASAHRDRSGDISLPSTPVGRARPGSRPRYTVATCNLELAARRLERCGCALALFARTGIETAPPFPLRLGAEIADDARDGADVNTIEIDQPRI